MNSRLSGLDRMAVQHVVATAQMLELGRSDQAASQLQTVLRAYPDHPEVLRLHAGILRLRGDHAGAIAAMRHALASRPDDSLYHNTMATVLADAGELDAAIERLRCACKLQPKFPAAWFNLGILLTRCVRYAEAAEALRHVLLLEPKHVQARAQLADLLRMQGHADAAVAEYRKLLAEQPWAGMAWWGLADMKTLHFGAHDIDAMRTAMHEPRASDDDRIATGFALARALDDQGDYANSLAVLAQANVLARQRQRWNSTAFSGAVDAIQAAFPSPGVTASNPALGHDTIFVVGMPRSGTTLVEQILASHSQVTGAGELPDVAMVLAKEAARRQQAFPHWVSAMSPADWQRLGEDYLQRTAYWRRAGQIMVDKMPGNWLHIGAIRAMLPGAHIVVCRRDPLETCLSCYRQHLAGNDYTRTFADLGAYWMDFDRTVRHWVQACPQRVQEHVYEDLLADPQARIRALLAFCGLPFESNCLEFHRTHRDVGSPSAMQVRQPLRRDTARAAHFGALLDPLRIALNLAPFEQTRDES
ncbi:MAG TPA: sulfotransferase [Rudaea sp.]|nr:sulfotransferase [Rudaea sp.]